ncbi:MAG TPA: sugar ABC transporter permease, partial [Lachnoclostridium phytofermentans]|nr:sugar ABC transporter permease [Lachnoclostridium phytofermentans]
MHKKVIHQLSKQVLCLVMVVIVLAPILLTLFAALKTKGDMVSTSPLWLPKWNKITLDNFKKVLNNKYLLIGFKNTGIILIISIFFNIMFGTI